MQARLQGPLDTDVEPALDRARHELHRDAIDQRAGQHGDDPEHQHQAQLEAGAEDLGPVLVPQGTQLPADQAEHGQRQHHVEADEERVVADEDGGVRRRRHQEEKPDDGPEGGGDGAPGGDEALHLASAAKVTGQVFQSEARLHSRLPSAAIWKGRGNWVRSRRMRSAAT